MLLREFYNTVILSEEQCVEFLRENQPLVQAADHPPCARCGDVRILKKICGVPATTFQSHLDYFCWCAAQECDIFLKFLRDIRAVYA